MKKIYLNFLAASLFVLAFQMNGQSQNLIVNSDFEKDGGSLNGWSTASGTTLGTIDADHFAVLHGENGVLYQKVTGISVGKNYKCTMYFKNLNIKQNTGYGYAIEKDVPLVLPEFTVGATNLKSFCDSSGVWTVLDATNQGTNIILDYNVMIPEDAKSIYICMGTKGAVSDMQVDSVVFKESVATLASKYSRNNENTMSVYPNPAKNEVSLSFNPDQYKGAKYRVLIYDQVGKMVRQESLSIINGTTKLSVQGLKAGLYFVQLPEINGKAKLIVAY